MRLADLYDTLAACIAYPERDVRAAAVECIAALEKTGQNGAADAGLPDAESLARAIGALKAFIAGVCCLSRTDMEELYTRTFDINPVCSLEIGWHLYGENYDRGAFLVTMRELLRMHSVPESSELPDHLTHALRVLGRMSENERRRFAARSIAPALEKMLDGIPREGNPYRHLIDAYDALLRPASLHPQGENA